MSRFRGFLAATTLLVAFPCANGQIVVGYDGIGIELTEFTTTPGGLCAAPNPDGFVCNAAVPPPCVSVGALFPIGSPLLGDVAVDPVTDITYITDGRSVRSYVGDMPCGTPPPCTAISGFIPNFAVPALGPITGLGCDGNDAAAAGQPVIYVTDGFQIVGLIPPLVCGDPPTVLYGPCAVPAAMQPVTDVSFDPQRGQLWMISEAGLLQIMSPMFCSFGAPPVPVDACGITGPFTGLAFDINTPNANPQNSSAWVCNAAGDVAYVVTYTGLPGDPTFAGPDPCTTQPEPLAGLAAANRGVTFGASRDVASIATYGQCTSPSTTFGIEVLDAPTTGTAFLIINFSVPGPGFFCPPATAAGTTLWVDPSAPGAVIALPPLGPGCLPIPFPLPAAIVPGTRIFLQFVFLDGPPPAIDATPGLACTVGYYD